MNRKTTIAYSAALGVLVVAAASLNATLSAFDIHIQKLPIHPATGLTLPSLPSEVEGFRMVYESPPMSKEIQSTLGTDNYLSRTYVEADPPEGQKARSVEVHTAYYTGMIDTVPHVPERCFVGSGEIAIDGRVGRPLRVPLDLDRFPIDPDIDQSVHGEIRRGRTSPSSSAPGVRVRLPSDIENLKMNVTPFVNSAGEHLYSGYFFIANGATVPRAQDVRGLAFNNQVTHAYYMKVQFTSFTVESAEELAELAAKFLNESFPDLMRRVPDWVDVAEGRHPATQRPAGDTGASASPD